MNKGVKKTIIIGIVVILVMVAYRFLIVRETPPDLEASGTSEVGRELLALLVSLQSISLDGDIFEREDFKSLRDFSVEIPEEALGRRNPFAPIGVGNLNSSQTDEENSADAEALEEEEAEEGEEDEEAPTATTTEPVS